MAVLVTVLVAMSCQHVDDDAETEDTAEEPDDPGGPGDVDDDLTRCLPGIGDCPDGFKCQPYAKGGESVVRYTQCVQLRGDKKHGDTCVREQYDDDCGKDLLCIAGTSARTGPGVCNQLCDGADPSSCGDHGLGPATCYAWNGGALPLCEQACHPLRPNCGANEGCYPGQPEFVCALSDPPPGKGRPGDDCYTVQSCAAGSACIVGDNVLGCESDACCALYCDLEGGGSECPAPTSCVAFPGVAADANPALVDVGACLLSDSE